MQLDHLLGTLQVGLKADLLLLEGDPLQDITLFQKPEKRMMIVQNGKTVLRQC
ncbi:hypothetical protein SDC9_99515 [bioreactor metagenome]|uniref:Amidohydrolase-related domain-containing protein n=1 Tax=bioreactor metagenome TaxID=1076179 RepID=A0A645APG0_9ZZZZ